MSTRLTAWDTHHGGQTRGFFQPWLMYRKWCGLPHWVAYIIDYSLCCQRVWTQINLLKQVLWDIRIQVEEITVCIYCFVQSNLGLSFWGTLLISRCNRPEFPPSQFFLRGKNWPVSFFPGERMGRPILSPRKKLTGEKTDHYTRIHESVQNLQEILPIIT